MLFCTFKGCDRVPHMDSEKCSAHRTRKQCRIQDCTNVVYARQLCVRHGGKKQCRIEGCKVSAQGGDLCIAHGGEVIKRFCRIEGCERQSHAKRLCVHHGGGRLCQHEGCPHHARAGGFCHKHKFARQHRIAASSRNSLPTTPNLPLPTTHTTQNETSAAMDPSSKYSEWWNLTQNILKQQYPWIKAETIVEPPSTVDPRLCLQMTQAVLLSPALRTLVNHRLHVTPTPLNPTDSTQIDNDISSLMSLLSPDPASTSLASLLDSLPPPVPTCSTSTSSSSEYESIDDNDRDNDDPLASLSCASFADVMNDFVM